MKILSAIRRNEICMFLVCILIASLTFSENYSNMKANPLVVMEEAVGGLLPENCTDLQMLNAVVIMEINERFKEEGDFKIDFDGTYIIYNPNNTLEVRIGAPFLSYYSRITDTLTIKADGIEIEHEIIFQDEYEIEENWGSYFGLSLTQDRYFALCTLNFTGFSNTTIHYSFQSDIHKNRISDGIKTYDALMIIYDLGTARAWNGNITERIEFRVHGEQPKYVFNSTRTLITDFESGTSYIWKWNNELIENYWVFIGYEYPPNWIYPTSTSGFDKISFISGLLAVVILFSIRKKKIISSRNQI